MSHSPLVSIILPTFNRCRYIEKALESVLNQTYQDFECIIIDDGSTDATPRILSQYANRDARLRIIKNQINLGLPRSLNKGIAQSHGSYIARLDDDDFWCDVRKLEKQVKFLECNPECVLVGGGQIRINRKGKALGRYIPPEQDEQVRNVMLLSNPIPHTSVLFRKSAWETAGGYDENLNFSEDWDLWMRFGSFGKYYNFQEYFVAYLQDYQNRSNEHIREYAKINLRLREKYRAHFPNFWIGYFLGICSYLSLFLFFQKISRPLFFKVRNISLNLFSPKTREASRQFKKIKVCQIVSADISLKFLLINFMQYLQREGFEVWAVSSKGKWIPEIENQGIRVHTVEITRKLFTPLADLTALIRLTFFLRKERFDIVHTHTPKASFLGQLAAFFARVPIRITTIHGLYFQEESSWQKKIIFMPIEWIIAKICHRAFSVNREDITTLIKKNIYPSRKVSYLGGGINVDRFNPDRFSKEFILQKKQEVGIPKDALVIGIVARLVKEKGFIPLFAAFAEIIKQFPEAILLVVGPQEPEKRDALNPDIVDEYGIRNNVLFLGERVDVVELYALMDVFVLPSYREGLGLSVLEASAMKRPVVASDIRGCREGVNQGQTGILVPSNNPARLAEALSYILSHPEEGKIMGEAGRKKVEAEFNEKVMFARMKEEYERLAREKISRKLP